jgi:hypothetical protein
MVLFRIRFITESDLISDAIRLVTFSEWSHVEIITDEGTYIGAHADGGIQERPADYCKPTRERRYAIPCTDAQLAAIMASARKDIGVPYDFLDIGGMFLHDRGLHSKSREICSEWVFQKVWDSGIMMLNCMRDFSHLITPEMLHLCPLLIGRCTYSFPEVT